ncbi:MAG TPA: hypothetical protein VF950_20925 [Planctomycetota bacterium]
MADNILKGVFKDGALVASVIQKEGHAKIMLKGAEPGDAAFAESIGKAAAACKPHVQDYAERELCAVAMTGAGNAETLPIGQAELEAMGLTKLSVMDGACGVVVRVVEAEPAPVPLAYGSLRSSTGLPDQPGLVEIPPDFPRKMHKDLGDAQKKVFEAAAQVAGRGIVRLVAFEDGGLKLAVTLKDAPPPRARSVLVPLGSFADDLAKGTSYEDIAKRMLQLRT